jgi:ElaB/YqjD/DUF883 family membrane-anchored ribosome-binding protein
MDENRLSETAKNPGESAEEGSVQGLYGQAKHSAADSIDAVRKMPGSVEDTLRHYIENRPYTTVAIALALGWLIGRSHRPF